MVKGRLDAAFGALADPTRRQILAELAHGPRTVGELAAPLPMSLVAASKHIAVLERAGLVSRTRSGRTQVCRLQPGALRAASEWLDAYRRFWTARLDSLESYLTGDAVISLRISRTLPAPPERVWRALTEPAALAAWFWPEASFGTTAEVDLRPGGSFRIDAPRRGIAVSGSYREVVPPSRLAFTWQWDGEPIGTLVSVTLRPADAGCELLLHHERFTDEAARDANAQGWSDCLDRLPAWLAETPAGR